MSEHTFKMKLTKHLLRLKLRITKILSQYFQNDVKRSVRLKVIDDGYIKKI